MSGGCHNPDSTCLNAADRDRHPADANGEGIPSERAKVKRLDADALIKPEMLQPASFILLQTAPIDGSNLRPPAECQLVECHGFRDEERIHLQLIINNRKKTPVTDYRGG
jgi:hypothetical protein